MKHTLSVAHIPQVDPAASGRYPPHAVRELAEATDRLEAKVARYVSRAEVEASDEMERAAAEVVYYLGKLREARRQLENLITRHD